MNMLITSLFWVPMLRMIPISLIRSLTDIIMILKIETPGNKHRDTSDCRDKSRDRAKRLVDSSERCFAVNHRYGLFFDVPVELLFDGGLHICRIAAGNLHDYFIVFVSCVVGVLKPVFCHDNGTVGTDIKAHPPLLDNARNPERAVLPIGSDGNPRTDLDIMIRCKCRSHEAAGVPVVVISCFEVG